jgi:hypothetical protein
MAWQPCFSTCQGTSQSPCVDDGSASSVSRVHCHCKVGRSRDRIVCAASCFGNATALFQPPAAAQQLHHLRHRLLGSAAPSQQHIGRPSHLNASLPSLNPSARGRGPQTSVAIQSGICISQQLHTTPASNPKACIGPHSWQTSNGALVYLPQQYCSETRAKQSPCHHLHTALLCRCWVADTNQPHPHAASQRKVAPFCSYLWPNMQKHPH